jgi:type IV secretion system protein VirD4
MTRSAVCGSAVCLLLASQVGTQVAAWQYHHAPVLGIRYQTRYGPLYPPTGLYRWTVGLVRLAGGSAFDQRLRLAWTAWGLTLALGVFGVQRRVQMRQQARAVTHWATRRDLRQAGLLGRHGVVLGRQGRRVLHDDSPTHVLIIGPTRAGKGENTVIPTLLSWRHSALVYDPKGELYPQTAPYRQQFSHVYRCDPTLPTTHGCNLLASVCVNAPDELQESHAVLSRLTDPDGTAAVTENATGKHFRELSNLVGQGLLLHALRCGHDTLPAVATLLHTTPSADLAQAMATQPHPVIQSAAQTLADMDGPQLTGLLTTLKRAFAPFLVPTVGRLVSRTDFALDTLRTGPHPRTIYYTVPFRYQEALRPVTRLFFHALFDAALASLTAWEHRLLVLLDEVTTLRQFPLLVDGFDFAAGYGMKLCVLVPSINRIASVYGPHHNFVEGSATRLIFPPNTRSMAVQLAPETGEQAVSRQRISQQTGLAQHGQKSVSTEETLEPLLSATGLAQLSSRQALLLVGRHPPAIVTTIRAWKEQPWKSRRSPLP